MVLSTSHSNIFLISINDCLRGSPVGHCFYARLGETTVFESTSQLILQIDDALQRDSHAHSKVRTLLPAVDAAADKPPQYGRMMTFSLRVLFRQNHSWQGEITWLERRESQYFRSVLELMQLLDRALSGKQFSLHADADTAPIEAAK